MADWFIGGQNLDMLVCDADKNLALMSYAPQREWRARPACGLRVVTRTHNFYSHTDAPHTNTRMHTLLFLCGLCKLTCVSSLPWSFHLYVRVMCDLPVLCALVCLCVCPAQWSRASMAPSCSSAQTSTWDTTPHARLAYACGTRARARRHATKSTHSSSCRCWVRL